MKIFSILLLIFISFIIGCKDLAHINPYDPDNPTLKNAGINAHFAITGYTIGYANITLGEEDKNIKITFVNDGKGSTKGTLNCYLSTTENSINFLVPNEGVNDLDVGTIHPGDSYTASYNISLPANRPHPYSIPFTLRIIDGYSNEYINSIQVTIN
jgi:hypothetical protein